MRIFILSWYFPPVNSIGAIRVGKFARFLIERGHEVGAVAGRYWGLPETLPLGVPLERAAYAKSIDLSAAPLRLREGIRKLTGQDRSRRMSGQVREPAMVTSGQTADPSTLHRLSELYSLIVNIPDKRLGWLPWAIAESMRMCRAWRPELIFASGPPMTALLAAAIVSRRLDIPWVAELRDRWADDPYETPPAWRARLDHWLERRVLTSAKALVTVTEPWAEFYRNKYGKPVATIYNGYDPADFPDAASDAREAETPTPYLLIGYTGSIYPGRRDPAPLFAAIASLGAAGERIRVVFCGTDPTQVMPLAVRAGVQSQVEVRPAVDYKDALAFQQRADVLLLMQWNDPREQGNCPGKFFEYIASRRPVLGLGIEDGVPATITRERSAGFFSNDPTKIARQLQLWLRDKESFGRVPRLPASVREGLSRTIQYERLEQFLLTLTAGQ